MILILFFVFAGVRICFGQLDYEHRMFYKSRGTYDDAKTLSGDVRVVLKGYADYYVYVNSCHHCHDYDLNITLVDGKAGWDEWRLLPPDSKKKEWFSVRFVKDRRGADFVIRIDNPDKIPAWLKETVKVYP